MRYVDAHHHIWPAEGLPWLDGPMVPRIFGPYEALQGKAYSIDEYKAISNYHWPTDTPENLSYPTIACAADLALAVARELAPR